MQGVAEQVLLFEFGGARVGVAGVLLGEDQVEVSGLQRGKRRFGFQLREVNA